MYFALGDKPESAQAAVAARFISTSCPMTSVTVIPESAADGIFSATGGFSDAPLAPLVSCALVLLQPANALLVHFVGSRERSVVSRQSLPDAMRHAPSGLPGNSDFPVEFHRIHAFEVGGQQVNSCQPLATADLHAVAVDA